MKRELLVWFFLLKSSFIEPLVWWKKKIIHRAIGMVHLFNGLVNKTIFFLHRTNSSMEYFFYVKITQVLFLFELFDLILL